MNQTQKRAGPVETAVREGQNWSRDLMKRTYVTCQKSILGRKSIGKEKNVHCSKGMCAGRSREGSETRG